MRDHSKTTSRRWRSVSATGMSVSARQVTWMYGPGIALVLMFAVALTAACQASEGVSTRPDSLLAPLQPPDVPALKAADLVFYAGPLHASPTVNLSGENATFNVSWSEGCETPPDGAVTTLDYAADIWGTLISSPVSIEVSACWTSSPICVGIACGDTTNHVRNFPQAPLVDTFYPIALANALAGQDLEPATPDITLQFRAGVDWSFATDVPQPGGTDFVAVALHELCHGLGFSGNMYESYNIGFCGNGPFSWYLCPTAYDRFAVDSEGVQLLSYIGPDPRVLGTKLKSDANFGGPNTVARNGGDPVKLYTPAVWDQGSSLSHLDPDTVGTGENALMIPTYSGSIRSPGPLVRVMLQDMGWPQANDVPYITSSGPLVLGVGHNVAFTGTLFWTSYTGQEMTYTWIATDKEDVLHTGLGVTDTVTLSWSTPGIKTVAVTAIGGGASTSATRSALVIDVTVNGLVQGEPDRAYTFSAALTPDSTAFLVTYTWQATGMDALVHPDQDTTDSATFTWTTPGTKTITVTATINGETAQAVHTIGIGGPALDEFVFLPLVQRP